MAINTNILCANTATSELQTTAGTINIGTTDTSFATSVNIGSSNLVTIGDYTGTVQIGCGTSGFNAGSIAGSTATLSVGSSIVTVDEHNYGHPTILLTNFGGQQLSVRIGNTQTGSGIFMNSDPTVPVTINSGISTAPASSNTATTAFGTTLTAGTALQNTTGYDIHVNICVNVTSSTTATLTLGVGPTSTPTTNTVLPSFSVAVASLFTFSAIVPNNYYLLVGSTGTITIGSITIQSCPL